jgi:hypothetical protein
MNEKMKMLLKKYIVSAVKTFLEPELISYFVVVLPTLLFFLTQCRFPFDPKITKYDNVLVVDGLLTNLPGSCYVKLTRTYPYNTKNYLKVVGAIVKIIDDSGNETVLMDKKNGLYLPEDTSFAGTIGRQYKVTVETPSGEFAESTFERIKEPVDVEDVYYVYVDKGDGINGLQLYVDTHDPFKESFYYSWDYEETWEFTVPYQSMSNYLPEMKVCYKDVKSRKVLIESTKNYSEDKVIGFPLFFIDNTTNRLTIKYSLLVRQYVLSEKTYLFYKNLKDINENAGTLFDRTPVILIGNMTNSLLPEQPVLGNFQVSGESLKRIFIYRDELPPQMVASTEYEFCEADLVSKNRNQRRLDSLIRAGWVVMDTLYEPVLSDTLIGLAISRSCFDCTTSGTITKPDFWDEK